MSSLKTLSTKFQTYLISFLLVEQCLECLVSPAVPSLDDVQNAMKYLRKYGYLETGSSTSNHRQTLGGVLRKYQQFSGLEETGELDAATLVMMKTPRCGNKDFDRSSPPSRKKRSALAKSGSLWSVTTLSYRISKYSSSFRNKYRIRKTIDKAFKAWSRATNLKFVYSDSPNVHIDISFIQGDHGDEEPFNKSTIAHAFPPAKGGDIHFNDEKLWTMNKRYGVNLFQTAMHEIGHSLGLLHSDAPDDIMYYAYTGYDLRKSSLQPNDISRIQNLYGKPTKNPRTSRYLLVAPDLCQDASVDAILPTADGNLYVFKCDFYWEITKSGIVDGFPEIISNDWAQLPGKVDAAFVGAKKNFYFFKDHRYWRFTGKKLDTDFPKNISLVFKGIPNNVDAVVRESNKKLIYFFKGREYWVYNPKARPDSRVGLEYPLPISDWKGLKGSIDAAIQLNDGNVYFFKGQHYYKWPKESILAGNMFVSGPYATDQKWFDC